MKMFPTKMKPVKRIYRALDELEIQIDKRAFRILKEGVIEEVKKNKKTINNWAGTDEYKEFNPLGWCCDMMMDYGIRLLGSGKYHAHRGVFHPLGEGPGIKLCILDLLDKSVQYGTYTEEEKSRIMDTLNDAIKTTG